MKNLLFFVFVIFFSTNSYSQEKNTTNTLSLKDGKAGKASINDMSWIAGHWKGEAFGGIGEEFWSQPMGGAMMGCYRIVANDTVNFYEMMVLREVDESLLLQIKHFNRDLKGWEEKDDSEDFQFIKQEGNRAYFNGFTFEKNSLNSITLYVAIEMEDGKVEEYIFPYQRIKNN